MDIQALLESGRLEAYVLGHSSPEEAVEIGLLAAEHPEVRQEIVQIEAALEDFAMAHALPPPAWMKGLILDKVQQAGKEDKLTQFITQPTTSGPMWWALLLMGIVLTASMVFFYSKIREKDRATDQANQLAATCQDQQARLQLQLDFLRDRQTKAVMMAALPGKDSRYTAVIYVNDDQRVTFLDTRGLTAPAQGKDYQLWALVAGQPRSMGVFAIAPDTTFISVPLVPDAEAYAVSLEPAGGSSAPTEVLMLGKTTE